MWLRATLHNFFWFHPWSPAKHLRLVDSAVSFQVDLKPCERNSVDRKLADEPKSYNHPDQGSGFKITISYPLTKPFTYIIYVYAIGLMLNSIKLLGAEVLAMEPIC